jgi:hypothetical protein
MSKALLHSLHPLISVGIDRMRLGVDDGAELNNKLLKAAEIQVETLSLIQHLDV